MLYTLAVILLIAWLLGVVGTYTIGAFVHVLLVVALVSVRRGSPVGPQNYCVSAATVPHIAEEVTAKRT